MATLPYTAGRHIDLNSKDFQGYWQMDFSWSIQQNLKVVTSATPLRSTRGTQHSGLGRAPCPLMQVPVVTER